MRKFAIFIVILMSLSSVALASKWSKMRSEAIHAMQAGDYKKAIGIYLQLKAKDNFSCKYMERTDYGDLADCYLKISKTKEDWETTKDAFFDALRVHADNFPLYGGLKTVYENLSMPEEARKMGIMYDLLLVGSQIEWDTELNRPTQYNRRNGRVFSADDAGEEEARWYAEEQKAQYYDSIGLSDLAEFVRAWIRQDQAEFRQLGQQLERTKQTFATVGSITSMINQAMTQSMQNKIDTFKQDEAAAANASAEARKAAALAEMIRESKPAPATPPPAAPAQPQPTQKQGVQQPAPASQKQASSLPVEVLKVVCDTPQGTQEPCGDYKGYQLWEQRVNYSLVNPNDYPAEVKFVIMIEGKSFNYTRTVNAHQTYNSYKDFSIGCHMYNPGIKEAELRITEAKIIK